MIFEKIIYLAVNLVVLIVIARYFGASTFGKYSYVLALYALLVPIASIGINSIIIKDILGSPEKERSIMMTALLARFLGGLLLVLLGGGLYLYNLTNINHYAAIGIGVALLFSSFQIYENWFYSNLSASVIAKYRLVTLSIFSAAKLLSVWFDFGYSAILLVYFIEMTVTSSILFFVYWIKKGRIFAHIDFLYAKNLLGRSKWLLLSGFASAVYLKVDILMLSEMVSNESAGIYSIAARLSELWYFAAIALSTSVFPRMLEYSSLNNKRYQNLLQRTSDTLFYLGLTVAILVSIFAQYAIPILFGEGYQESSQILVVHIWGGVFIYMRALFSKWLIAENLLRYSLVTHLLGAVVNLGMNLLLIPKYGAMGAAYSTVASYAVASYLSLFFSFKTRPFAHIMTRSIFGSWRHLFTRFGGGSN